jgi:hypothetical protein
MNPEAEITVDSEALTPDQAARRIADALGGL